jgi:hypothetical protein
MSDPFEGFLPPLQVDTDNDRRGFLKKAGFVGVAAAAATVGAPLVEAPSSSLANASEFTPSTPQERALVPYIGQTVDCSCNAFGATLFVNLPPPLPTLNFIGSIVVKLKVGGDKGLELQVLDHTVQAGHPMFGYITIRLPDVDVSPASILNPLGPGGLVTEMFLNFKITFDRCGDCPGPFTFDTLSPARLTANLASFPPPAQGTNADGSPTGGALYHLMEPIQIGDKKTGIKYMELHGMNINVGQKMG